MALRLCADPATLDRHRAARTIIFKGTPTASQLIEAKSEAASCRKRAEAAEAEVERLTWALIDVETRAAQLAGGEITIFAAIYRATRPMTTLGLASISGMSRKSIPPTVQKLKRKLAEAGSKLTVVGIPAREGGYIIAPAEPTQ